MLLFLSNIIIFSLSSAYHSIIPDPYVSKSTSFYLKHPTGNRTLYGPVGNSSTSFYSISQWEIPEELSTNEMTTTNCSCLLGGEEDGGKIISTFNRYARVCLCNEYHSFDMYQDGGNLDCGAFPPGVEYDLFVEPYENVIESSPILSSVSSFKFEFTAQLNKMNILSYECGGACEGHNKVTYSSVIASMIFSTSGKVKSHPQTLFVQFVLFDSRRNECKGLTDPCSSQISSHWFSEANPVFGINFGVGGIKNVDAEEQNANCIEKLGEKYEYSLEVMDVVSYISQLKNVPEGFDQDWSHWRISSFYLGTIQEGKVQNDLVVGKINLSYILK